MLPNPYIRWEGLRLRRLPLGGSAALPGSTGATYGLVSWSLLQTYSYLKAVVR